MTSEKLYYWEYSFDLIQRKLEVYYNGHPSRAYTEVGNYLRNNGFNNEELKQGSCYFTSTPMPYLKVDKIIRKMYRDLPWLIECIRKDALMERPLDFIGYTYSDYREKRKVDKKHKSALSEYMSSKSLQTRIGKAHNKIKNENKRTLCDVEKKMNRE